MTKEQGPGPRMAGLTCEGGSTDAAAKEDDDNGDDDGDDDVKG